jgi:hypothetical protein
MPPSVYVGQPGFFFLHALLSRTGVAQVHATTGTSARVCTAAFSMSSHMIATVAAVGVHRTWRVRQALAAARPPATVTTVQGSCLLQLYAEQ